MNRREQDVGNFGRRERDPRRPAVARPFEPSDAGSGGLRRPLAARFAAWWLVAVAAGAWGLAVGGCSSGGAGGPPADFATEVDMAQPERTSVADVLSAVGTVEANERVELKPETAGRIAAIRFEEGEQVERGQVLFELDSGQEEAALEQAKAEASLAAMNLQRADALSGTRAISAKEIDQLRSQVEIQEASARVAQERLEDRVIVAPFDGVVGPRLVSPGQFVGVGAPLGTLVDLSEVKIAFRAPEQEAARLKPGQEGSAFVRAFPDTPFNGTVDLVDPEVDPSTRTVWARLRVPNSEGKLKPGMFARVEVIVDRRENALVIPESALIPSLREFSVFRVEDGTARLKPVKIGVRLPGKVEVREGLAPSDTVVTRGTQKLVDGMKVTSSSAADSDAQPASEDSEIAE